jgi:hypothetical protein
VSRLIIPRENGSVIETPRHATQPIRQTKPEKFNGDRNKTRAFLNYQQIWPLLDEEAVNNGRRQ